MGLRCLLGHDFSEAEIEREREEDGDQMVVTIREVKTCDRCGAERVISENKEVTSIRSPEEIGLDADAGSAADTTPGDAAGTGADATGPDAAGPEAADPDAAGPDAEQTAPAADRPDADGAEVVDSDADPADAAVGADHPADGPDAEPSAAVEDDPETDDGVILSEEDQQRERGEWPDAEEVDRDPTARGADRSVDSGDSAIGGDAESGSEGPTESPDEGVTESDAAAEADSDAAAERDRAGSEPAGEGRTADADDPTVAAGEGEDVEIIGDTDDAEATADAAGTDDTETTADVAGTAGNDDQHAAAGSDAGVESDAERPDPLASGDGATAWPDHGGEDEGFDAEVGGDEGVSFSGNSLTPDVDAEAPDSDAEYVESDADGRGANEFEDRTPRADVDTGIAREGSASIDLSDVADDAKFYCPNCGLARSAGESSMRAGDICPECRKGYIAERKD